MVMPGLILDTSSFDASKADSSGNRAKKLGGSYGLTTVVPMPEPTQRAINGLLSRLIVNEHLSRAQPNKTNSGNKFLDEKGMDLTEDARVISPIEHLHTTIASWQIMDAVSPGQWENELIRSRLCSEVAKAGNDVFSGFYRGLIYDTNTNQSKDDYIHQLQSKIDASGLNADQMAKMNSFLTNVTTTLSTQPFESDLDPTKIQPFRLEASSLKLNNDGNIVIQWKSSPQLKEFRQELCKNGGLAKWGDQVGTTIAYFPNWDKLTQRDREGVRNQLDAILKDVTIYEQLGIQEMTGMDVVPEQLQLITFSRNNLADNSANWGDAVAVFDENRCLNQDCLSVKSYDAVVEMLDAHQRTVLADDEMPQDQEAAVDTGTSAFKTRLQDKVKSMSMGTEAAQEEADEDDASSSLQNG